MKITKRKLQRIIKEELRRTLSEARWGVERGIADELDNFRGVSNLGPGPVNRSGQHI